MNRKEFLINFYRRVLKPVLLGLGAFFCIKFLINVFTENGSERFVLILLIALTVLFVFALLIGSLFNLAMQKISAKLPPWAKRYLKTGEKIANFIVPLFLGAVIYHLWLQDWLAASVTLGIILFERIRKILGQELPAQEDVT